MFAKLITIFIVLIVLVLIVGGITSCCNNGIMPNYADGVRTGELYKASYKGLIWKSYEAELKLSDFNLNNGTNQANVWSVSSTDPAIGKQLEALAGRKVKITYRQWYVKPIRINSDYEALKVEALN